MLECYLTLLVRQFSERTGLGICGETIPESALEILDNILYPLARILRAGYSSCVGLGGHVGHIDNDPR